MFNQIKEIQVIPENERDLIQQQFNATATDYSRDKCVHTLFEEQAARTPDSTAVITCDRTLTYRELNAEANCIAHALMVFDVGILSRSLCPGKAI